MNEFLASLERFTEKTAFLTSTLQIYTITKKIVVTIVISEVATKIIIKRQKKDSTENHLYFVVIDFDKLQKTCNEQD